MDQNFDCSFYVTTRFVRFPLPHPALIRENLDLRNMFTIFVTLLMVLFATVSTGFCYAGGKRFVSQNNFAGIVPAAHNTLNQVVTAGAGPLQFAGTLDEPGSVTINGKAAEMRNRTLFEVYLDLSARHPSGGNRSKGLQRECHHPDL